MSVWKGKCKNLYMNKKRLIYKLNFIDTLIDSWTLMGSPYPLLSIFALYLWIVLKAGPKYMKNREAFNLNNVTRIYNIVQVSGCAYFIVNFLKMGVTFNLGWQCVPLPKATDEITQETFNFYNWYYSFMLFRIFEFLETFFFVLRKKQHQASFLHLYHHCAVVALLWCYLKYSGGISEVFIGLLNSSVHCVMYSYYFLSSFGNLKPFTTKIKSIITFIQIAQLLAILAHCFRALLSCEASKLYYIQAINIMFLVGMFMKFYFKNYLNMKMKPKTI